MAEMQRISAESYGNASVAQLRMLHSIVSREHYSNSIRPFNMAPNGASIMLTCGQINSMIDRAIDCERRRIKALIEILPPGKIIGAIDCEILATDIPEEEQENHG